MKTLILFSLMFLSFISVSQAQDILGSPTISQYGRYGGFYDYSDPTTLNVKVSVWGFVRYPGRYLVPIYTTVSELLSFAGGPDDGAHLDDVRLYRTNENKSEEMIALDYNDIVYEDKLDRNKLNPTVKGGDILVLPGSPKYYFREWLSMTLSIFSAMVSLTILIINLNKN